ncbi:hypothetical protein ACFQY5_03165 [Paeniroseomonas aquatica]|uniref:hypothetical protein n=1 Tax=Paeniroseomonas aquatica TaxID=373043 RepID=UPI00360B2FB6
MAAVRLNETGRHLAGAELAAAAAGCQAIVSYRQSPARPRPSSRRRIWSPSSAARSTSATSTSPPPARRASW